MTELKGPFTMDPGFSYTTMEQGHSAYEILKANFDAAYSGSRLPMPLYVHPFFLRAEGNLEDVQRFIGGWVGGWWGSPCLAAAALECRGLNALAAPAADGDPLPPLPAPLPARLCAEQA